MWPFFANFFSHTVGPISRFLACGIVLNGCVQMLFFWVSSSINNLFLSLHYAQMPWLLMCPMLEITKPWDLSSFRRLTCLGGLVSFSALVLYIIYYMACLVGANVCGGPRWIGWEPVWFVFPHISLFHMFQPYIFQPWFCQNPNQEVSPLVTNQGHICENSNLRKMFAKGMVYCLE